EAGAASVASSAVSSLVSSLMIVILGPPDGGSIILWSFARASAGLPNLKRFKEIVREPRPLAGISTVSVDKFVEKTALPWRHSTLARNSAHCTKIRQDLQVV